MKKYHFTESDFAAKEAARVSLLWLLEPLKPFYSEGGARVDLGATSTQYEKDSIQMESFARPLWGLVPGRLKGEVLLPEANTSLIFPKTAIPMAVYPIKKGTQTIRTQVDYFK